MTPDETRTEAGEMVEAKPSVGLAPADVTPAGLTLAEVQSKLNGKAGKRYWRSMEELADTPGFQELLAREFPRQSSEWVDGVSRRGFLKLAGASLALAGLSGCTKQPDEPIFAYVKQPEDLILGRPMYFATAFPFPTGAQPLLVKSDAFRPIKIEGNPDHPFSKGGSDPIAQATLLEMYDPDRSQHVLYRGETSEWPNFLVALRTALEGKKSSGGQGVYVLSSTVTSPTLGSQIKRAQAAFPQSKWYQYDPVNGDSAAAASKAAFGEYADAQYQLANADLIVSLDADFLSGIQFPGFVQLARDYTDRRKLDIAGGGEINRLYSIESMPSTTGLKADHRLALRACDIEGFAAALAGALGAGSAATSTLPANAQTFLASLAKDLKANGGKSVVIPGHQQSTNVHLAAIAINQALGNVGKTVIYTETLNPLPSEQNAGLKELVADLNAGKVDWLLILGANPVYTAPADLNFADAMKQAKTTAHVGLYQDETSENAHWHIPQAHYLEAWSDARAYDGTVTIIQPMIEPLYGGKSLHQVVEAMLDEPYSNGLDVVRANWKQQLGTEQAWRNAIHQGWIDNTKLAPKSSGGKASFTASAPPDLNAIEVIFRADPHVYDGRYANVGWLQEVPRPLTSLSWDNAALMAAATATRLKLEEGDVIEIAAGGRKITAPVLVVPGHPQNSITLHLGQGRSRAGRVGSGVGFDAYRLRSSDSPLFVTGVTVTKTDATYKICAPRSHYSDDRGKLAGGEGGGTHSLEADEADSRGIIRSATIEEYKANPAFAQEGEGRETVPKDVTLLKNWNYETNSRGVPLNAWGMAIDMNSCVGCNACVVSCYAENNIAVVGRHQVKVGRIMQWIRVDTYFEGDLASPRAHFQPMTCQHCENAGCEQVCPVAATVHTPEGINTMVYNRCVGTRYCSNNCPYKVRRFNWLLFSDYDTESLKLMRNPDVSVRSRGVMEKCSYCLQRINAAKIEADIENRAVRDGEVVTACQQACPTGAISFGNLNDSNSKVSKIKASPRNYAVLGDLNYRPRTTYIAEVHNPNPELASLSAPFSHGGDEGAGEGRD